MIYFRAINAKKEIVTFTLGDSPVVVDKSTIALMRHPGSYMIKKHTVHRGMYFKVGADTTPQLHYEGDIVYDSNTSEELGYLVYVRGWYLQEVGGLRKNIPTGSHIKVKEGSIHSILSISDCRDRTKIKFLYKGVAYRLESVVMSHDGGTVMMGADSPVCEDECRINTGFTYPDMKEVFFGDIVEDNGEVCLHGGRVVVNYPALRKYKCLAEVLSRKG